MEERQHVSSKLAGNEAHDDISTDVGSGKLQMNQGNESHGLSSNFSVLQPEDVVNIKLCTTTMKTQNDSVEGTNHIQPPEVDGQMKQEGQFSSEGAAFSVTSNSVTEPKNLIGIVHKCSRDGEITGQGRQDERFSQPIYVKESTQHGGDAGKVDVEASSPHLFENKIVYDKSPLSKISSGDDAIQSLTDQLKIPVEKMDEDACRNLLETQAQKCSNNLNKRGHRGMKTPKTLKKKYLLRSSASSDRALRSRTRGKSEELESNDKVADATLSEGKRSRRRKKRRPRIEIADEYSRIRKHLYYLLNRISYERNLIEAYSSEGWKGLRYTFR